MLIPSVFALSILFVLYGSEGILTKGSRTQDITVIIKSGTSSFSISEQLVQEGVFSHPWFFLAAQHLRYPKKKLKAGEYLISKTASPWSIITQMSEGRTVIRKLTIPEGLMVSQIVSMLENTDSLSGRITFIPPEGTLLPETYSYSYGDDRQKILNHMHSSMTNLLNELWLQKVSNHPHTKTPHHALVLASIVEKETRLPTERRRVASVFLNRLKIGMRLQADPTVIYAITEGKHVLERQLTKKDLQTESPFNTYTVTGLPPSPIACPGRAAIEAVLDPETTKDLYFVADGTGGHVFSATLKEHNQRVTTWRKISRRKTEESKP
ncbi:MAG: endolytic transglycosylase MltG [Alphaproteobacteria bacterium]|nr:endolytic transglycosylase MltG [Alphaproteobacteria bacterium]